METNSLIEEKNLFETDGKREEMIKLRLEAADLKLRLLKIKERQMELLNQEKKKKMKESTPPPLKERKEIRKESLNNYNDSACPRAWGVFSLPFTVYCLPLKRWEGLRP